MHATNPKIRSVRGLLCRTPLAALLMLGGCRTDPLSIPATEAAYSITAEARTALASVPGSDWSGIWSTDFVGLDAHYRITHLGQGRHVLESIAAHNAGIQNSPVMASLQDRQWIAAAIDGREILFLEEAAPGSLCRQGQIRRPEVPDVALWMCRADEDESAGS